jgi:hypothetical protein
VSSMGLPHSSDEVPQSCRPRKDPATNLVAGVQVEGAGPGGAGVGPGGAGPGAGLGGPGEGAKGSFKFHCGKGAWL